MIKLVLLGSGNVALHLYRAFSASQNIQVIQVYNHTARGLDSFGSTPVTTSISKLEQADVYLLALKDDVIPEVSKKLKNPGSLVAHTSGAVTLEAISSCNRAGVFYPLQTFSKHRTMEYGDIPFCLEASGEREMDVLKTMALEISGKAYEISSAQRKRLHLSAVFVCNFVNHLYVIGEEICRDNEIPFSILQPLIEETAQKIKSDSPSQVQTGPAIRKDQSTIQAHLDLLKSPEQKEIYQLLTRTIQSFHGKKL